MSTPHRARPGRPPSTRAGEVEQRLLDAATPLFLVQGFGRTTMDQVSTAAATSKTTLYARYPGKADLFTAVIRRLSQDLTDRMATVHTEGTPRERLTRAGTALADLTLTTDTIASMRVTAAEAVQFPELARLGFEIGFGSCVRALVDATTDDTTPEAVAAATTTATRLVELALHPLHMHALFGADLDALRARAPQAVADVVAILVPAPQGRARSPLLRAAVPAAEELG